MKMIIINKTQSKNKSQITEIKPIEKENKRNHFFNGNVTRTRNL